MSLEQVPASERIHIGFFGARNAGKSSLVNALTGQEVSIVSEVAGTTTDAVRKSMELLPLGAVMLADTAGFDDDDAALGMQRIERTKRELYRTDLAVLVVDAVRGIGETEQRLIDLFEQEHTPYLTALNQCDRLTERAETLPPHTLYVSAKTGEGVQEFKEALGALAEAPAERFIVRDLVRAGDTVVLVTPIDGSAPKGRLILPQVQTIRDLLDHKCLVMSCTTDKLEDTLAALARPPKLIITDSQVFRTVYDKKPEESLLTSFSVLFAEYKGDFAYYKESAAAIASLTEESKVLIAECCTHAPLKEDIGREKIPNMLKKRIGAGLTVDIVSGTDFPKDLSNYDLIIQCGACMFNKKYVMTRIERAKEQNVPMSNYGVVIAYLSGILDKISY